MVINISTSDHHNYLLYLILDDFGLQPLDNQNRLTLPVIIEDRHSNKSPHNCLSIDGMI